MAEYIDREKVLALGYWHGEHPDFDNPNPDGVDAVDVSNIEAMPAADVAEVVHGRWYMLDDCANAGLYCSACGRRVHREEFAYKKLRSKYCQHCGARMDGGADHA